MIATQDLSKRFGKVHAVREVSLVVREGDRYGLLGPNGSGKTTLVRMLLGLVFATSGSISVLGEPVPRHVSRVLPQIGAGRGRWWARRGRGRRPFGRRHQRPGAAEDNPAPRAEPGPPADGDTHVLHHRA